MIKVYVPNMNRDGLGGGFSFLRNFRKALKHDIQFVDSWEKCDIIFIFGITTISDKGEIFEAVKQGKRLVLRVDNIPKKSRNKRMSPAERLREFGKLARRSGGCVIYQSNWAKDYAGYFAGDGEIIYNGVDTEIFNTNGRSSDGEVYLYIDYNPNPNKRLDEALYWFDRQWRENNKAQLILAGNMPTSYREHPEWNWDIPTDGRITYVGIKKTPEDVAKVMRKCDILIYPSFAEACPNTLLEAMACGVKPMFLCPEGGTVEVYLNSLKDEDVLEITDLYDPDFYKEQEFKVKTIKEMGQDYLKIFKQIMK